MVVYWWCHLREIFKVTICDLKDMHSVFPSRNLKSGGKRARLSRLQHIPFVSQLCFIQEAIMSTTTIRLDAPLKRRIAKLAQAAGRTPHSLMAEALEQKVDELEAQAAFSQLAATRDQARQRVFEATKRSIEPEQLVMNFPGAGTEGVPDVVGRGKGDDQQVGARAAPEPELARPFEGKRRGE